MNSNDTTSNTPFPRPLLLGVLTLAALLPSGGRDALAQTAPSPAAGVSPADPTSETVVELSPFTVLAEDEQGYTVKSTTAGSRVRVDVRDVGAQIDILSARFLEDVAADRPEEAALYSLNVENEQDNPASYGSGDQNNFERQVPGVAARGFSQAHGSGATRSREFFETTTTSHGYNTSTVAFSSGPNAILFGLGQPGGAMNTGLNRANLNKNSARIKLRGDSHGSVAGSFDGNWVLLKDRLAGRFAVLEDRTNLFQEPNFADETRYYGTLTIRPLRQVELRLHHESVEGRDTPAQYRLPRDEGSTWDPATDPLYSNSLPANQRPLSQSHGVQRKPVLVFDDNLQLDPRYPIAPRINHQNAPWLRDYVRATDPGFVPGLDSFAYTLSPDTLGRLGLPYEDHNLWGNTLIRTVDSELSNAFLEFNPARNLFFEAAYNRERFSGRQAAYGRSARYTFARDIDRELDSGALNPRAGEFFVGDEAWGWESRNEEEEIRLTANYRHAFRPGFMGLTREMASILGQHDLSLMYSDRDSIAIRQRNWRTWVQNNDGTTPSFITRPSALPPTGSEDPRKQWLARADRGVALLQYIDPYGPTPYMQLIPGWDPVADLWTLPDPGRPGSIAQARMFSPEVGGGTEAENYHRNIRGRMLAYQAKLWNDRIVATYGLRRDKLAVRNLVGSGDTIQNYTRAQVESGQIPDWVIPGGNFPWWTTLDFGEVNSRYSYKNETKGLVLRPNGLFRGRFDWLSLTYNESTNNSVGALKLNVTGEPLPPVTGDGKDYGVRIDLMEGRLGFRVNWFENSALNTDGSAVIFGLRNNLHTLEERYLLINPEQHRPDGWDPTKTSVQQFQANADIEARGVEVSALAAPTRNWNFRLAVGKNVSRQSNVASDWINWAENRISTWESARWYERDLSGALLPVVGWRPNVNGTAPSNAQLVAEGFTRIDPATGQLQRLPNGAIATYRTKLGSAGDTPITGWGNIGANDDDASDPTTMRQFYQNEIDASAIDLIRELNGRINPNVRKWRANFTMSYEFLDGALDGLSLGGSARFRDRSVIGFAGKVINAGTPEESVISDISRPYYNDREFFIDAMAAYRGRIARWDLNYKVQLNVRNVFDETGPYPVQADTRGIGRVWAVYEPRTWILSCDFAF